MPPPRATNVFAAGLAAPPVTEALESLVLTHLEQAALRVQEAAGVSFSSSDPSRSESCPAAQQDVAALVTEMGDYLARTAMIWSCLIQSLIQGPHIDLVTLQILQKSKADTRVADLSASVSMDVTLSRLRQMRDLAEKYSRDVQAVWRIRGHRRPSPSCSRASPASHDGSPSVAPSVTSPVTSSEPQTVPDELAEPSHAPKRRKQLPDAAAAPRERLASTPHPPLPPLPLLPPASSLLLPPILSDGADCAGAAPTNNAAPRQPPIPAKPPSSKAAVREATAAKPLLTSTPMVTIPPPATEVIAAAPASVATSESAATPPAAESPTSVATPASDATPTAATPIEQDDSDDYSDENQFAGINMKALKQRGKGKYYCPRGHHCDKGGVDKQGNLVLFDRNSSFAYVVIFPHPARGDEPSDCVPFLACPQVLPTSSDH
ncbi:hypothetical protein MKX07_007283 [Trichoderma sp. CBMAI-0711]|uniref:Uncharacterized protein n=1 Tax=Trichoderma parareesei TaxID=858221 RepID=A0A2H2ZX71_TRIPA|nr:hypothetical protein MKX07_007283 [Trichoderma sp. CBMAI-0711]OTA07680.1 hypothetical protein A9Z42_0085850 [Trichoderma parareesei]